jgi:adenosine deaminase
MLDIKKIRRLPKVELHRHLDGALRPQTIIELAADIGYELPADNAEDLAAWFVDAASSGSLEEYLKTFAITTAVMQTAENLHRVAYEATLDAADDGIVYVEYRYAPEQHLTTGLSLDEVVEAVNEGFRAGEAHVAATGRRKIRVGAILDAMRHLERSVEIAELTLRHRDAGVVGFDIAGPETGFPPTLHLDAFNLLHENQMFVTIHAGESEGPESMKLALWPCGAHRIGHGVRIADDIDDSVYPPVLTQFASWVRNRRVPLELCPTSNVQTGAAPSIEGHPIDLITSLGYTTTINTDNPLQGGTTLSNEFLLLVEAFGWGRADIKAATIRAAHAAFLPYPDRQELIDTVIRPGFGWCNR